MSSGLCVVMCFLGVTAMSVTGRRYSPMYEIEAPFLFEYKKHDRLDMHLTLILPSNITGGLMLISNSLNGRHSTKSSGIERYKRDQHGNYILDVRSLLIGESILIDVQLYKPAGICLQQRVTEGREEKRLRNRNKPICLNGNHCRITLNLTKECAVPAEIVEARQENAMNVKKMTSNEDKSNVYVYIIIPCSIIVSIILIALVIIAFMRRYYINRMSPPIVLIPRNPFYVNLLFRKECQKEIDELEAHIYEEII